MSALALRTLAIVLMLLDHIGYFTGNGILRIIGRMAFPIFAFLIANGFKYTKNVYKYALRIFLFAIASEFVFDFCFGGGRVAFVDFGGRIPRPCLDNVFFTLLIGLCYLILDRFLQGRFKHHKLLSVPLLLIMAYGAAFIGADYGALGVFWVALFGLLDVSQGKNFIPLTCGATLLAMWRLFVKSVTAALGVSFTHVHFLNVFILSGSISFMDTIQCFAAFAVIPVFLYNGRSGALKNPVLREIIKYAFYVFYPLHILVLYIIFR